MGKLIAASLTLVRHGETVANRENIIQGQIDTCLSETGRQQALMVGSRLQNERWTHVFASDLSRATQTAQVIVEANKYNHCSIISDRRLRERKYGVMEGKTFRELTAAAKSKSVTVTNFTPCGAEHIEEVRKRAKSFFHDLLDLLKNNAVEEVDYTPASIKTRVSHSLNNSVNPNTDSTLAGHSDSNSNLSNKSCLPDAPDKPESISKRPRHEDGSAVDQHTGVLQTAPCASGNQPANKTPRTNDSPPKSQAKQTSHNESDGRIKNNNCEDDGSGCGRKVVKAGFPDDDEFGCPNISVSPHTCDDDDSSQVHFYTDNANPREIISHRHPASIYGRFNDSEIKTIIKPTKTAAPDCPNVSLSPLLEHRLPSVSSVSSGRNSSFDDTDGTPLFIAEVLVVSHGGLLKELIRHMIEDFKCRMPGGKGHALRVGPNASLSKFTITVDEVSDKPIITCLRLHDKDHLLSMDIPDAQGTL
ncbi:fructose-2,6-bisphosphatase TIGAR-like [Gigantopelta aegis]|uniref:fructose-2,6-bisphosphatase TIGAR-like n=1 Tax=Gigantopelta aegis TaxID=1735272 RepID=UPI001B8894D8|nr:fructose-2,6-bisphosphatase TIGAR-like [Gigantopelta aegis]